MLATNNGWPFQIDHEKIADKLETLVKAIRDNPSQNFGSENDPTKQSFLLQRVECAVIEDNADWKRKRVVLEYVEKESN